MAFYDSGLSRQVLLHRLANRPELLPVHDYYLKTNTVCGVS